MVILNQSSRTVGQQPQVPDQIAILPSGDAVLYPATVVPLNTHDPATVRLIDEVGAGDRTVGIFAQRSEAETPSAENLYQMGTAAVIVRMFKTPDGGVQALLQGVARIRLLELLQTEPYVRGRVEVVEEVVTQGVELEALTRNVVGLFQRVVTLAPNYPQELGVAVANIPEPGNLADFVASNVNLTLAERQELLETLEVTERLRKLTAFVNRELEILELGSKIQSQIKEGMDKHQREFFLREQLRAIQKELGEGDEQATEIAELRERLGQAQLPSEAQKEADRELERLSKMSPLQAEYMVSRTYLDWVVSLPWDTSTQDSLDVKKAAQVLDEDHYDLEKVKERVLDFLAVRKLKPEMKGPILCFVGPPGTGKTSVGHSIARALGRKFVRLSLGGVRDEAEIRGHRRTYIGALPGRIIQGLRTAGSNNPVFMLDEVDKLGVDFRGDPAAALLEVLDPQQNNSFTDHYLDVPFDLSKVMFITTANLADAIPPPLLDRMEVLELPGYTEREKLQIAKRYLLPRQMEAHGLKETHLRVVDEAIATIIREYTREAGVRNLERELGNICRRIARHVVEGAEGITEVGPEQLSEYLGPKRFRYETAEDEDEVGVATGLAWTPVGGEILFVEAALVPGRGHLTLTGHLGDVMQESAQAALTYARARVEELGGPPDFYEKNDVHIHLPAGAIPKDGPSAGVTMVTSLVSAITHRPVSKGVAMTGEITLRGKVLPVGGIKEKVLGAHRAGIKRVILPRENERDLEDVPEEVRNALEFVLVEEVDDVIRASLKKTVHKPVAKAR